MQAPHQPRPEPRRSRRAPAASTEAPLRPRPFGASVLVHALVISGALGLPAGLRAMRAAEPGPLRELVFQPSISTPRPQQEPPREETFEADTELPSEEFPEAEPLPVEVADDPWEEVLEIRPLDLTDALRAEDVAVDFRPPREEVAPPAETAEPPPVESAPASAPPPNPPRAFAITEVPPRPIARECPQPTYPAQALRRGLEGTVVCLLTIDVDGRVADFEFEARSGHAVLDEAVREKLLSWRFQPGTREGEPAEMVVRKTLVFRLP